MVFFFPFLKYSKLNIGIFILQNIFSLFPIHLSIKSFLLPKLWLKCPTFFVAGLGPIVFFYRWITWPDVLLGCFLVLTWCCFSFDWLNSSLLQICPFISWLMAFLLSSLPQYHWLLFHHIAEEIQISSFLKWHHIRLWCSCCCSSSSCLVSHVFYFFFFFLYIIGILFKMSCCYALYLITLLRQIVIR